MNESKVKVVYFGATWCGPCRVLKPKLKELIANTQTPIIMEEYDVDTVDETVKEQYAPRLNAIPCVCVYADDKCYGEYLSGLPQIVSAIKTAIKANK